MMPPPRYDIATRITQHQKGDDNNDDDMTVAQGLKSFTVYCIGGAYAA